MSSSALPPLTQGRASSPTAAPLRRIASPGSSAQPSTSVQAAQWITRSGSVALPQSSRGAAIVQVEVSPSPLDGVRARRRNAFDDGPTKPAICTEMATGVAINGWCARDHASTDSASRQPYCCS